MADTRGVLAGGPHHGRRMAVAEGYDWLAVPELPRMAWEIKEEPRPPWRHPFKRIRWHPSPPPEPPKMQTLLYRRNGQLGDGSPVYWYRGEQLAPPSDGSALIRYLGETFAAVHPADRHNPGVHWVMGSEWWKACRRVTADPGEDESEWKPDPRDTVLGIRIVVDGKHGAPRLIIEDGAP